jgi:hypothetical protein
VAVADLHEAELALLFGAVAESIGLQHSALDYTQDPSTRPRHAFEKAPTVDSVMIVIVLNEVVIIGIG